MVKISKTICIIAVSIVSIKTDQSRRQCCETREFANVAEFQSYQSRQINPDICCALIAFRLGFEVSIVSIKTDQSRRRRNSVTNRSMYVFQSYQSRQINPDQVKFRSGLAVIRSVSIVSIKTDQSRHSNSTVHHCPVPRVSIVSIKTDQSRPIRSDPFVRVNWVSIVSIKTDQSRPC